MYDIDYVKFLAHFHSDRDYFECHELLEEYWKEVDPGNKQSILVGFIQLAVSQYHHRRGNFAGAKRTLQKARTILIKHVDEIEQYGLNWGALFALIDVTICNIQTHKLYESLYLPISDELLKEECQEYCDRLQLPWWQGSNLAATTIVNRHLLRDRSDVIAARDLALKRNKRSSE